MVIRNIHIEDISETRHIYCLMQDQSVNSHSLEESILPHNSLSVSNDECEEAAGSPDISMTTQTTREVQNIQLQDNTTQKENNKVHSLMQELQIRPTKGKLPQASNNVDKPKNK